MIVSSAVRILRACSKVASITGLQGISLSFRILFHFVLFVVYHLQGQTGRFMVLLNGSQSSGLVKANFRVEYFTRKNRTTCSDVPLLLRLNFPLALEPKSRVPFTFQPGFLENFGKC